MLQEIPPRASDPDAVITELEELFRGVVGDKISFRTNLDAQLGGVPIDPTTFGWVLVTLAASALKAMLARSVVITTSNMELDQGPAGEMNVSPGPYIRIELGVTGSGVDAQPAIWNIVQQAHGAISVRNAGTDGVTVTMLLPRIPVEELPDRKPSASADWRGGAGEGRRLSGASHCKVMLIVHVSDEDLELYFLGRLPSNQISTVESHLTDCTSCTDRLSNVTGVFLKILKLKNRHPGNYEGIEKRREHRVPFDGPGRMQAFSPFSPAKTQVQVMNVSRNGLKLRTPQFVARGAMVQVVIEEAIILGEVRYCVLAGGEFAMGMQILDLIPKVRA